MLAENENERVQPNKVLCLFLGRRCGVCRGEGLSRSGALQAVGGSVMWWGVEWGEPGLLDNRESFDDPGTRN